MSNDKPFLYQLNINRNKYPDIVERLEKAKAENGIAFYIRKLIEADINNNNNSNIPTHNSNNIRIEEQNRLDVNIDKSNGFI